jgi:hypothetical protein
MSPTADAARPAAAPVITWARAFPAVPTLLVGWNPDETYWLTDVLTPGSQARAWHNHDRTPLGWQEVTATA